MCLKWWQRCSAESAKITFGTARLSCVVISYSSSFQVVEKFNTVAVDGSYGFRCNRDERLCPCQWGILGCLPVRRRFCCMLMREVWDVTGRYVCAVVSVTVTSHVTHTHTLQFHPSMVWVWHRLIVLIFIVGSQWTWGWRLLDCWDVGLWQSASHELVKAMVSRWPAAAYFTWQSIQSRHSPLAIKFANVSKIPVDTQPRVWCVLLLLL